MALALWLILDFLPHKAKEQLAIENRKKKLLVWHDKVDSYIKQGNPIPSSLYAYCSNTKEIWFIKVAYGRVGSENISELLENPSIFNEKVEYSFLRDDDEWFIIEDNGGFFYKERFMIDDKAKIYMIKEE